MTARRRIDVIRGRRAWRRNTAKSAKKASSGSGTWMVVKVWMGQRQSKKENGREEIESSEAHKFGCMEMIKERKSRFYIARRCLIMLICWHKYGNNHIHLTTKAFLTFAPTFRDCLKTNSKFSNPTRNLRLKHRLIIQIHPLMLVPLY